MRQGTAVAQTKPAAQAARRCFSSRILSRPPRSFPGGHRVVAGARGPAIKAIKLPNMGGGLPLTSVERPLRTRSIVIPTGNHDNNQHSFDENLRIQNLWDGIELMAALLTM